MRKRDTGRIYAMKVGACALTAVVTAHLILKRRSTNNLSRLPIHHSQVLTKSNIIRRNQVEHTRTERNVLGRINHPFIVGLNFAFQTPDKASPPAVALPPLQLTA